MKYVELTYVDPPSIPSPPGGTAVLNVIAVGCPKCVMIQVGLELGQKGLKFCPDHLEITPWLLNIREIDIPDPSKDTREDLGEQ